MAARRTIFMAALVAISLALSGCLAIQPKPGGGVSYSIVAPGQAPTQTVQSGSSSSGSAPGGATSGGTQGKTVAGPRPVGVLQQSGPWKVNVQSAETAAKLPDGAKAAGGREFLLVDVTVQNAGTSAALIVRPNQFELKDSHGAQIKTYRTSLDAFNAQGVRPIDVAMGGSTTFVYEVPKGSSGYGFVVTPKQGATGSMSWIVP
jgi:hypothetical protein